VSLPNPQRSRAVLIGTSRYSDDQMPDIPAVTKNIEDLQSTLADPNYGIVPAKNCTILLDEGDIRSVGRDLQSAVREAEDLLLVYYAGHGLLGSRRHELYLALRDSEWAAPEFNSLEYEKLRSAVLNSPASTKIVILDCCFSGRAISDSMAPPLVDVLGQLEVAGTYVLTSAHRDEVALVLQGEKHTAFTGRMLRFMHEGIPGGPELLTIDDLYRQVSSAMRAEGLSEPQKHATRTADMLALSRNRAFTPSLPLVAGAAESNVTNRFIEPSNFVLATPSVTPDRDKKQKLAAPDRKHEVAPIKTGTSPQKRLGSVEISPHALARSRDTPHPVELIPTPHQRISPGAIVVSCSPFWKPERKPGIYVLYQDSTAALLAPDGAMPDVSPAGDCISYVVNEKEIWLMRPNGSDRRLRAKLTEPKFRIPAAPRWSPDGKYLAFELREEKDRGGFDKSNIYLLDVSTGRFNRVTSESWIDDCARGPVTWTANGHMVVSVGGSQLCMLQGDKCISLLAEAGPVTSNIAPGRKVSCLKDPARSPNGYIIFVEGDSIGLDSVSYIVRRQLSRGRQRTDHLLDHEHISSPRVLADNETIVYASSHTIYRAKLDRKFTSAVSRLTYRIRIPEAEAPTPLYENASDPVPILREWEEQS